MTQERLERDPSYAEISANEDSAVRDAGVIEFVKELYCPRTTGQPGISECVEPDFICFDDEPVPPVALPATESPWLELLERAHSSDVERDRLLTTVRETSERRATDTTANWYTNLLDGATSGDRT